MSWPSMRISPARSAGRQAVGDAELAQLPQARLAQRRGRGQPEARVVRQRGEVAHDQLGQRRRDRARCRSRRLGSALQQRARHLDAVQRVPAGRADRRAQHGGRHAGTQPGAHHRFEVGVVHRRHGPARHRQRGDQIGDQLRLRASPARCAASAACRRRPAAAGARRRRARPRSARRATAGRRRRSAPGASADEHADQAGERERDRLRVRLDSARRRRAAAPRTGPSPARRAAARSRRR